jgi:signal transduction histidine kinase
MRPDERQPSLLQHYLLFSFFIVVGIFLFSLWIGYSKYTTYQYRKSFFIEQAAIRLANLVEDKIKNAQDMAEFFGNKIVQSGDYSSENVSLIIRHERENVNSDSLAWRAINFVNADGYMLSSNYGQVSTPIPITPEKRSWIVTAREDPWKLHFSKPDKGMVTFLNVLPAGMGLTDKKGNFVGYIAMGLNTVKLRNTIINTIGHDDVAMVLLDYKMNIVASSDSSIEDMPFQIQYSDIAHTKTKAFDFLTLKEPVKSKQYVFHYYMHLPNYPLVMVLGSNYNNYESAFAHNIFPEIAKYVSLAIVFIIVTLFLGLRVIKPILELSRAADAISKGRNVELPTYNTKELDMLAKHLGKIQVAAKNLRTKQEQLRQANIDLMNANAFIKSNMSFLSHELINPLSGIINFARILRDSLRNSSNKDDRDISEWLFKAAMYQNKQLNFFLKLFKFQENKKKLENIEIDLKELIDWNISMVNHQLTEKNIKITRQFPAGPIKMLGDEVMISQMFHNLIANSVKYNKSNGKVDIKLFIGQIQGIEKLIIEISDTGIGIAKKDLEALFRKFSRIQGEAYKTIGYGLGLYYAKSCVVAHDGEILVDSEENVGTKFTLLFPDFRIIKNMPQETN